MKKIFFSLLMAVIVVTGFTQVKLDSSQHLTFKGVPLDGTLDQYVLKMKQNGFIHSNTKDGTAILHGDFAGYKDCQVLVSILKQKNLVYKIGVLFPEKETWSTLAGNYFDLKQMLTEKYGKPSEEMEKFDNRNEPRDDGVKIYEVKLDRCKYYSVWISDKGEIKLSIDHNSMTDCFIKLTYLDKINGEKIKKQALDDL